VNEYWGSTIDSIAVFSATPRAGALDVRIDSKKRDVLPEYHKMSADNAWEVSTEFLPVGETISLVVGVATNVETRTRRVSRETIVYVDGGAAQVPTWTWSVNEWLSQRVERTYHLAKLVVEASCENCQGRGGPARPYRFIIPGTDKEEPWGFRMVSQAPDNEGLRVVGSLSVRQVVPSAAEERGREGTLELMVRGRGSAVVIEEVGPAH
jgi:hypothetical protein